MAKILLGIVLCLFYFQGLCEARIKWVFTPRNDDGITDKNLTFQLFTRDNGKDGVSLVIGDKGRLLASGFNGYLPTKICTHGFMDNGNTSWIKRMKNEILENENANFIILDWSACAKNVFYEQTIICMKTAGRYTGQLLNFLQKEGNLNVSKAHLIGHSLGAHLMSFASDAFPAKKTIGRITGLDPAGPLFEHAKESERLNSNAAKFVDIIHTCRIFTGMKKPIGTVDFYPNGGYHQPGCADYDLSCNHSRSHTYFIEAINKNRRYKYLAKKCEGLDNAINGTCYGELAPMGYYSENSSPGIYYLKITSLTTEKIK